MEGRKRGLSKSIQRPLRVFLSKMEPYKASVDLCSPCPWPWCLVTEAEERVHGKKEWKSREACPTVLTFLHLCAHQKLEEQPNKRCFTCFSHKTLVEMCMCTSPGREGSSSHMGQIGLITHWC